MRENRADYLWTARGFFDFFSTTDTFSSPVQQFRSPPKTFRRKNIYQIINLFLYIIYSIPLSHVSIVYDANCVSADVCPCATRWLFFSPLRLYKINTCKIDTRFLVLFLASILNRRTSWRTGSFIKRPRASNTTPPETKKQKPGDRLNIHVRINKRGMKTLHTAHKYK